ncbi:hypothetical protein E2C01_015781 [Portunus trituberculatus]|uniref:Uncharacterized protein n=1 Tax=Portunus trituberculatus TaxID=210409 RepID=A0A5B7DNR0_PORTR|nr:hypothetical protein [Portunus trituberculatus]
MKKKKKEEEINEKKSEEMAQWQPSFGLHTHTKLECAATVWSSNKKKHKETKENTEGNNKASPKFK